MRRLRIISFHNWSNPLETVIIIYNIGVNMGDRGT